MHRVYVISVFYAFWITEVAPVAAVTSSARYRRYPDKMYPGVSVVSGELMSAVECGMSCAANWICSGYAVRWITPESGYCGITRDANPATALVNNTTYTFYETLSYKLPFVNVAVTSDPYRTFCSASSNLNNDLVLHGCEKVMDGQDCDADQCNWISNGEGVGSWIELDFNQTRTVVRIDVHSRNSPQDQCSELQLDFSDDAPIEVQRICQIAPPRDYFSLNPMKTTNFVRITCLQACPNVVNHGFTEILVWALP